MADRSRLHVPEEFLAEIEAAGRLVDALLPVDFAEAARVARRELDLLMTAEAESGRDLHKGHPLYNLGLTLFGRQPNSALRHFAAAFVEDVRTYQAPRRRLAARAVRQLFGASVGALGRLATLAMGDVRRNPLDVVDEAEIATDQAVYQPIFPGAESDDWLLETPPEQLVFVGGSYSAAGDRIFQIADQVADCGLRPVVVGLLRGRPNETERQKSFRILDLCGLAAFDGTVQERPGWWAEVEHIVQSHQIPTLIAYFSGRGSSYKTSAMFPTDRDHPRLVKRPFGHNLKAVVRSWLSQVHMVPLRCGSGADRTSTLVIGSNTPYMTRIVPSGYPTLPMPGSAHPEPQD